MKWKAVSMAIPHSRLVLPNLIWRLTFESPNRSAPGFVPPPPPPPPPLCMKSLRGSKASLLQPVIIFQDKLFGNKPGGGGTPSLKEILWEFISDPEFLKIHTCIPSYQRYIYRAVFLVLGMKLGFHPTGC